jgi:hypothetical protein
MEAVIIKYDEVSLDSEGNLVLTLKQESNDE